MARGYDVVVVGEVHDNPQHHTVQADFARKLRPGALVFEMILPERAAQLAKLREGGADRSEQRKVLEWDLSGWPDYSYYADIMDAADGAWIAGALVLGQDARRAFDEGAAATFGKEAARFGLMEALGEAEQEAREALQFAAHCEAMPLEMMGGMVEAQRVRDAALAAAVLRARAEVSGALVLVITGNGHAHKRWGLPAALARAAPEVEVFVFGQFEAEPPDEKAFDAWHLTAAPERGDPCDAFRKP